MNDGQTLFAPAATVQALARARAVVVLIGSYDGSGNYGDIAQFDAARALVERLGPRILALPLLERRYLADHRELSEGAGVVAPHSLFFDPDGGFEDDLMPVAAAVELCFGACYLYGGGYLNRLWGARKLAMLEAAEVLLAGGGVGEPYALSSGLQVEPGWIAGLGAGDGGLVRRCDLLGARDGASRLELEALGSPAASRATTTGDDAIGVLRGLRPPEPATGGGERLRLNVHFAEHDWMNERPRAVLDFCTGFLAELRRLADRPLTVRPLLAFLDGRVDERAGAERLAAACSTLGIEVAEPLVLRPAALAETAPLLSEASLTLSCSYHVALTSLMLEIPAVLLGDNPYYVQKAAGLAADFQLPPAFLAAADADPAGSAREIAATVLEETAAAELRRLLADGARAQRGRRAEAEAELLGRLGGAAIAALGGGVEELSGRLRQRAAEPAELQVRLAELRTECEELQRRLDESPLDAELRVQEAEARAAAAHAALATTLGSRSWRLAAPLRRVGALRHRRRAD